MFSLRMSLNDKEVSLQPDDKLKDFFDEEQDITQAWSTTITSTEPLPYSPLAMVTGYITRPRNKEKKGYKDTTKLEAVSWKLHHNPKRALGLILGQTPYQVGLELITSDNEFNRATLQAPSECHDLESSFQLSSTSSFSIYKRTRQVPF